jgi:hypothetical protein
MAKKKGVRTSISPSRQSPTLPVNEQAPALPAEDQLNPVNVENDQTSIEPAIKQQEEEAPLNTKDLEDETEIIIAPIAQQEDDPSPTETTNTPTTPEDSTTFQNPGIKKHKKAASINSLASSADLIGSESPSFFSLSRLVSEPTPNSGSFDPFAWARSKFTGGEYEAPLVAGEYDWGLCFFC